MDRHTTMVHLTTGVHAEITLAVRGAGSLSLGSSRSVLNVVCEDVPAARRLHELTGELLIAMLKLSEVHERRVRETGRLLQAVPDV